MPSLTNEILKITSSGTGTIAAKGFWGKSSQTIKEVDQTLDQRFIHSLSNREKSCILTQNYFTPIYEFG